MVCTGTPLGAMLTQLSDYSPANVITAMAADKKKVSLSSPLLFLETHNMVLCFEHPGLIKPLYFDIRWKNRSEAASSSQVSLDLGSEKKNSFYINHFAYVIEKAKTLITRQADESTQDGPDQYFIII